MKERPILFSAPMVRAILEGRKMQTRRTVKGNALEFLESGMRPADFGGAVDSKKLCPYGQPGDRLWVRETWAAHFMWKGVRPSEISIDERSCLFYAADGAITGGCQSAQKETRWRASIHMPRAASRITLEITGVRVERLQDITNNDALDEGTPDLRTIENGWDMRRCFQDLWEQINGVGSWAENPWVWVIEFRRVTS